MENKLVPILIFSLVLLFSYPVSSQSIVYSRSLDVTLDELGRRHFTVTHTSHQAGEASVYDYFPWACPSSFSAKDYNTGDDLEYEIKGSSPICIIQMFYKSAVGSAGSYALVCEEDRVDIGEGFPALRIGEDTIDFQDSAIPWGYKTDSYQTYPTKYDITLNLPTGVQILDTYGSPSEVGEGSIRYSEILLDAKDSLKYGVRYSVEPSEFKIILLANSIDYELASGFVEFLTGQGIEVVHSSADDFTSHIGESFIVILGGPDAPEGVGHVVRGLLDEGEQEAVREAGAVKFFALSDMWVTGQNVLVIAGSGRVQTVDAVNQYRVQVASMVGHSG